MERHFVQIAIVSIGVLLMIVCGMAAAGGADLTVVTDKPAAASRATGDASTGQPDGTLIARVVRGESGNVSAPQPPMGSAEPVASTGLEPQPQAWILFSDESLDFSLTYPDTFSAIDDHNGQTAGRAATLRSIRFQDSSPADGDPALLAPPQFRVDVFDNQVKLSLEQWLDINAKDNARVPMTIDNLPGYQITLPIEVAPNQFYYVSSRSYKYKLTPLGMYGQQMLHSFKVQR
jgi:hypothetical protein